MYRSDRLQVCDQYITTCLVIYVKHLNFRITFFKLVFIALVMRRIAAFATGIPLLTAGRHRTMRSMNHRAVMTSANGRPPLGVVITGSTAGLGLALAEEFVKNGAHVVVNSRRPDAVDAAVQHLRALGTNANVYGATGDVSSPADVTKIFETACENLPSLDAVICNAGATTQRVPLKDVPAQSIVDAVNVTLLGAMLTTREAQRQNAKHVFHMEGAGSQGFPNPKMAVYSASKRGLANFTTSVRKEGGETKIHLLSPGMMLTRLLLRSGTNRASRFVFNALAEEPETVAKWMVPRVVDTVVNDRTNTANRFLTIHGAILKMAGAALFGIRRNRFFIEDTGERVGNGEYDELGVRRVVGSNGTIETSNENIQASVVRQNESETNVR